MPRASRRWSSPQPTRDHTERALAAFGADVAGGARAACSRAAAGALAAADIAVPGDPSSAAFWAAAAAAIPGRGRRARGRRA
ncbi:MAG: hypothetical protein MZV64_73370 [Ignavibacteriales bacterium]|nr:hypothetical protein [Ignavibacteriales bacterium]